jgi:hypothetical protein
VASASSASSRRSPERRWAGVVRIPRGGDQLGGQAGSAARLSSLKRRHSNDKQVTTMFVALRRRPTEATGNPLMAAVRPLGPRVRSAMLAAARDEELERRSWTRCPLSRAGAILGGLVGDERSVMEVLGLTGSQARGFLAVWDRLPGSHRGCTALLREAIEELDYRADTPSVGEGAAGASP